MARIEHIKRRLENWAMWKARGDGGGLGYATRSVLLSDTWSRGSYNGMVIPVLEADAQEIDAAVQSLRLSQHHLFLVLGCIYLRDLGIKETARQMQRAESTVKANLEHADHAIDRWVVERMERLDRCRAQAQAAKLSSTT
ncbi:MAG: hypothetical protein K2Q11_10260 [Burkholderiaceae bacterium]|nr:hypothetical protein [Burkholderiaceae bacterium]